jgi:peroxiredoxin
MPGGAGLGRWVVAGLLVAAAAVALLFGERGPAPIVVGRPAPDFALPAVGGEGEFRLSDRRGRVVLLNFWATWCKPCEDEMPAMERLYQALASEGLEMWAVSVDVGEEEVLEFRERLGLSFPLLHDPDREVAGRYQSFRFPETWLIDREGRLAARFIGPRDWDAPVYVERVRGLIGEGAGDGAG